MADLSLNDKIKKYYSLTGSVNRPESEDGIKLFEQIFNKDAVFNYKPLDINALREYIRSIREIEIESCVNMYSAMAKSMGIDIKPSCNETNTSTEDAVEEFVEYRHSQIRDTGDDEMSPEEMIVKGLQGLLQGSRSMQIELGDETLKKLGHKIGEALETLNNPIEPDEDYKWQTNTECKSIFENSICGYNRSELEQALELKKALLLMGVPGTGKTKILKYLLNDLTKGDKNRYKIITFGQETTYTDFIGGIVCINGQWKYVDGIFTTMCKLADEHPENKYYIGIDELSRGNAESIFGELMTGIEHRDTMLTLKNGRKLVIPHNLYIICTMNVTDNSTKKLDIAMLERFVQFRIAPQWNADYINKVCNTTDIKVNQLLILVSEAMFEINKLITNELNGRDKVIGTRSISDIQLTPENTKGIIRTQLLTEVEDRIKTYDNAKYQDYINIIKGACDEK